MGTRMNLHHEIDDVFELGVVDPWSKGHTITAMEANLLAGKVPQGVIEQLHVPLQPAAVLFNTEIRVAQIMCEQLRIVNLQKKTGIDYDLVFLSQGLGNGHLVLFRSPVVVVGPAIADLVRSNRWDECFLDLDLVQGRFKILQVPLAAAFAPYS